MSVKAKQTRSKGALSFFRDECLHVQQQLQPQARINPASKDFWDMVKSKWQELSPQQQQYYEELSFESKLEQQSRRAAQKRDEPASSTSGAVAVQQGNRVTHLCVPSRRPGWHAPVCLRWGRFG